MFDNRESGHLSGVMLLYPPGVYRAEDDTDLLVEVMRRGEYAVGKRVLDIGTGSGALAIAAALAGATRVTAVDLSLRAVAATWLNSRLQGTRVSVRRGDLFAPVAAHLASGAELLDAGDPLDPSELTALEVPCARSENGVLVAHALVVDGFGNVSLDATHADLAGSGITLGSRVEVEAMGRRHLATFASTFADVGPGEILLYEDAYRTLALAINRGDAAAALGIEADSEVRLSPR